MIKIVNGDLLKAKAQVIGHQTNCFGAAGGLAGVIFKTYPECVAPYERICEMGKALGKAQLLKCNDGKVLANLFGQYQPGATTDYRYVKSSLEDLKDQMEHLKLTSLALPYGMGAGIGGGDWSKIHLIIHEVFEDSPIEVTLCRL